MAMKRCPVCGERYSDTYKECPFCEEEEYWEEEQEVARRPILREGVRSSGGRGGRSAYSIVTPILIVLIVLMALLLVYLLYGDKLFNKDGKTPPDDSGKTDITTPVTPPATPGTTPAADPEGTDDPDGSGEPSGADTPDTPGTGAMPEGGGDTGSSGTASGGSGTSGGMSYASAAALPGGLTLNLTDFTRSVSEGAYKLRVSGGTGTYTWISENPSIATVGSDGTITPVASGITNVVVTDGSKRAICIVRVTGGSAPAPSGGGTSSGGTTSTPSTTPTTPAPSSGGSLKAGGAVVVNGGNGVRVRSGPGTTYDILATVPNGGSVQVVRATGTDDWYEITFTAVGGVTTTGYMKGEFLANS